METNHLEYVIDFSDTELESIMGSQPIGSLDAMNRFWEHILENGYRVDPIKDTMESSPEPGTRDYLVYFGGTELEPLMGDVPLNGLAVIGKLWEYVLQRDLLSK